MGAVAAQDGAVEEPRLIDAPRSARVAPGALAAAAVLLATVVVARTLGSLVSVVGAPAFALLLGMALRFRYEPDAAARRVLRFSSQTVLQALQEVETGLVRYRTARARVERIQDAASASARAADLARLRFEGGVAFLFETRSHL